MGLRKLFNEVVSYFDCLREEIETREEAHDNFNVATPNTVLQRF